MKRPLLEVENLNIHFRHDNKVFKAVNGMSFSLKKGETLGIVGESGSGKSVTAQAILGLLRKKGCVATGDIRFHGKTLSTMSPREMRRIRGRRIAMISQEPLTSLNPVYTVGYQIDEAIRTDRKINRRRARERTIELLYSVGIPSPEKCCRAFPHQLSGGMRQRVMIAMALAHSPEVLLADEPTTALDVTIQAQILELINELKKRHQMAVIMITHDLGVIAEVAQKVLVAYAGQIMEYADVCSLFSNPLHPYTIGLKDAVPNIEGERRTLLSSIEGNLPDPSNLPAGCPFHPRCQQVIDPCRKASAPWVRSGDCHWVRCWQHSGDNGAHP